MRALLLSLLVGCASQTYQRLEPPPPQPRNPQEVALYKECRAFIADIEASALDPDRRFACSAFIEQYDREEESRRKEDFDARMRVAEYNAKMAELDQRERERRAQAIMDITNAMAPPPPPPKKEMECRPSLDKRSLECREK